MLHRKLPHDRASNANQGSDVLSIPSLIEEQDHRALKINEPTGKALSTSYQYARIDRHTSMAEV